MVVIHVANLSSIDLNLLVALDALLSEAHVGRAARRVGLSQPATSHALKRLRDLLSDPLLVRVGHRMELTPRAAALRETLAETLQRIEKLLVADSFEPRSSLRRFSIMMQDHVAHLLAAALLRLVQREAPHVQLDILPWQSPASMKPERLRSIDLLISCTTQELAGFEREPLFSDTEVTVVRRAHPSRSRLPNLKAFLTANHVAVVGRGLAEDPVDTWLKQEGYTRKVALRVPSYVQALQAVAQSDLVAFVPKHLAQSLERPLALAVLKPPINPGTYQEGLFHPRLAVQDPGSIWLRRLAIEVGKQFDPGDRRAAN
jgi:DNA-binding transcriptional LysR family regulator